jgi:hypothetical protein
LPLAKLLIKGHIIAKAFAANGSPVYITERYLITLQQLATTVIGIEWHVLIFIHHCVHDDQWHSWNDGLQMGVKYKDTVRKAVSYIKSKGGKLNIRAVKYVAVDLQWANTAPNG